MGTWFSRQDSCQRLGSRHIPGPVLGHVTAAALRFYVLPSLYYSNPTRALPTLRRFLLVTAWAVDSNKVPAREPCMFQTIVATFGRDEPSSVRLLLDNIPQQLLTDSMRCRPSDANRQAP